MNLRASLLLLSGVILACGQQREMDWGRVASGIRVTIVNGDIGAPDQPLKIQGDMTFTIELEVKSASGENLPNVVRYVRLSARPGNLKVGPGEGVITTDSNGRMVADVALGADGRAAGIHVTLTGAFGQTRIWAQDIGYSPPEAGVKPACSNGEDDDLDGDVDLDDVGCFDKTDNSERGGTMATGVSEIIYVDTPTIAQVQGEGASTTPYEGESVTIEHGFIVVTRVSMDGMYVTDITAPQGEYNSLFVYNFNTPAFVRVCDRLVSLTGIMSEFYKFTEMGFPTWVSEWWDQRKGPCPVPKPHVLTASDLGSSKVMEGYEAALVEVRDVLVGDHDCKDADPNDGECRCDLDGNGLVDYIPYDPKEPCSAECECRKSCENDTLCTDLSQYEQYGQWAVQVGGSAKLWVVSRQTVPDFNPFAKGHPKKIASITGTLRQMSFLRPAWILEPRCPDDLVIEGVPKDITERCVYPRTGEELDELQ